MEPTSGNGASSPSADLHDPARFLRRIPELRALIEDRRIAAAVEEGDPHRLYRALWWCRQLRRLPQHAALLTELLEQPMLFLRPLRRSPWLITFNGFGATLYGGSNHQPDGSYLAGHYVTAFLIPLFPLRLVRVRNTGPSQFLFMGEAPFTAALSVWRRLVQMAMLGALVLGASIGLYEQGRRTVHVVNAFSADVTCSTGTTTVLVPARGRAQLTLPTGRHTLEIRVRGSQVLERQTVELVPGNSLLIWNLLGAAPLYREVVSYGAPAPPPSPPEVGCGRRWIEWSGVDHAFENPPRSISTPNGGSASRIHVGIDEGGPFTCSAVLAGSLPGLHRQWLASLAGVAGSLLVDRDDLATHAILAGQVEVLRSLCEDGPRDDDSTAHALACARVDVYDGHRDRAHARVDGLLARASVPEGAFSWRVTLTSRTERRAWLDRALPAHTALAEAVRSQVALLIREGKRAEALAAARSFQPSSGIPQAEADPLLTAYLFLGMPRDALERSRARLAAAGASASTMDRVTYGLLCRQLGEPFEPARVVPAASEPHHDAQWVQSLLPGSTTSPAADDVGATHQAGLARAVVEDPAAAARLAREHPFAVFGGPSEVLGLIAVQSFLEDPTGPQSRSFALAAGLASSDPASIAQWIRHGGPLDHDDDMPTTMRVAASARRAQQPDCPPADRAEAIAYVRTWDQPPSWPTAVIERSPSP